MKIKEYIEKNPIYIIVVISSAVAATTAGTVQFFSEKVHKAELIQINTRHSSAISTLQTRLVSIERKIGESETFFDISRLILPPDSIRTLGEDFRTVGNDIFYIAEPDMSNWSYQLTSEYKLLIESMKFNNEMDDIYEMLKPALDNDNLHLWKNNQVVKFKPNKDITEFEFNLFPHVGVQKLKISDLQGIAATFFEAFNSPSPDDNILSSIDKLLEELDKDSDDTSTNSGNGNQESISLDSLVTITESEEIPDNPQMELEAMLSNLFRGDIAAFMLSSISQQIVAMPTMFPGSFSTLRTVQKKGNVLYIQSTLNFPDAIVEGHIEPKEVTVYQEFIIATNSDSIFFVKIQIPSINKRSKAFPWVSQWLSGVRIPVNSI